MVSKNIGHKMKNKTKNDETIQISIRIPKKLHDKLEEEKNKFSYISIQSIILESLRNRYFKTLASKDSKRGRPREINLHKVGSAEKVFK